MNQEQVLAWAREAGFRNRSDGWFDAGFHEEKFERFAALVAAAEREACAKVADKWIGCDGLSAAIRTRGSQE